MWLADATGIKNENNIETGINPSTNFGNLSQMIVALSAMMSERIPRR